MLASIPLIDRVTTNVRRSKLYYSRKVRKIYGPKRKEVTE
jgi:hypothetical protein